MTAVDKKRGQPTQNYWHLALVYSGMSRDSWLRASGRHAARALPRSQITRTQSRSPPILTPATGALDSSQRLELPTIKGPTSSPLSIEFHVRRLDTQLRTSRIYRPDSKKNQTLINYFKLKSIKFNRNIGL